MHAFIVCTEIRQKYRRFVHQWLENRVRLFFLNSPDAITKSTQQLYHVLREKIDYKRIKQERKEALI